MISDCYDYLRKAYDVPAYVGGRVTVAKDSMCEGRGRGVIVPAKSNLHYVHVQFPHDPFPAIYHPRDLAYEFDSYEDDKGH